jgi:hypothetical protein
MQPRTATTWEPLRSSVCLHRLHRSELMNREAQGRPTLSIVKGPQTGSTFVLQDDSTTLGREPSNSVFLNDMTVSRHHARIVFARH